MKIDDEKKINIIHENYEKDKEIVEIMFEIFMEIDKIRIEDIPAKYRTIHKRKYLFSNQLKEVFMNEIGRTVSGTDIAFFYKRDGSCEMFSIDTKEYINEIIPNCFFDGVTVDYSTQKVNFDKNRIPVAQIYFVKKDGEYYLRDYSISDKIKLKY